MNAVHRVRQAGIVLIKYMYLFLHRTLKVIGVVEYVECNVVEWKA